MPRKSIVFQHSDKIITILVFAEQIELLLNGITEFVMDKKKMIWIISLAAIGIVCTVAIGAISIFSIASAMKDETDNVNFADKSDITVINTAGDEPIYFVRTHEGVIGIFSEDNILLEKLNVATMTLPQKDRDLLSRGITVRGTKNLEKLKQDYNG